MLRRLRVFALLALLATAPTSLSIAHAGRAPGAHLVVHRTALHLQLPPTVDAGASLYLLIRTAPRVLVHLRVTYDTSTYTYARRTGKHGRAVFPYTVPYAQHPDTLLVTVRAVIEGRHLVASKTAVIRPFVLTVGIEGFQVWVRGASGWEPTTQVHLGEDVRFMASYGVLEPAGNFFPPCVSGMLRVLQGPAIILSVPVQCPAPQPLDSLPVVFADARFTDVSDVGPLVAELDLTYDEGPYGVAKGIDTTDFTVSGQ